MLKPLKIAIRRQKRLILIFLLTVFIPSAALSIFGLVALRNERYRLEKQVGENQSRIAEIFKSAIRAKISEVENTVQFLAQSQPLIDREPSGVKSRVEAQSEANPLLRQFFILYRNAEPWFPPVRTPAGLVQEEPAPALSNTQSDKLWSAERSEYIENNYRKAIGEYQYLLKSTAEPNLRAQFLNPIARNQSKLGETRKAIQTYREIISGYPGAATVSGIPLSVSARLELISCYQTLGNPDSALRCALDAYAEVVRNWGNLSPDQLNNYVNTIRETLPDSLPGNADYAREREILNADYQDKTEKWEEIATLNSACLPDINREIQLQEAYSNQLFRYSKTINSKNHLIIYSLIPGKNRDEIQGISGVTLNCRLLESSIIDTLINDLHLEGKTRIHISGMDGRSIYGSEEISGNPIKSTVYFENNFPPWKIELVNSQNGASVFSDFYKSFYFWTIITLIIILIFGVLLIGRTLAHEMEVIKIKSEFVSSVSHEFKTPITSIKGLTERLIEGKVKDPVRMQEYYSVIAQDTENLSRLVTNFLNFAKIEEGKDQYDFQETDFKEWLEFEIHAIRKIRTGKEINIITQISSDISSILIDQRHFSLVLNNLIDNSIKFATGNIEIKIIAEKSENNLRVKIEDNGIGIPKKELQKIFEKFYQGDNAAGLSVTGTGLGLTLVKRIAEAHGGMVQVESETGKGSTFILTLPLKK